MGDETEWSEDCVVKGERACNKETLISAARMMEAIRNREMIVRRVAFMHALTCTKCMFSAASALYDAKLLI